jgi:hypothetical protein
MSVTRTNEPRCFIRVPVSFRDKVNAEAKKRNMEATVMLEKSDVVYNV